MSEVAVTIIAVSYAALLAYYILLEKQDKFWHATILKVILSAYAAAVCIYAAIMLNSFILYIFALGLVFAVPADFFLQYIKTDLMKYRAGIFFFGLMHVCLLITFFIMHRVTYIEFIIFAVFIGILLTFQTIGKWKMGKEKNQLTVYTVFVVLMAAKSISIFIAESSIYTVMLASGGFLFFLSDLFLGIWAYQTEKFLYLALNRSIYFAGQLCLAFYLVMMIIYSENHLPAA